MNNIVEQGYWKQVASLSGQQRIARSLALFDCVNAMIAYKIRRRQPGITDRHLKREIAKQLYRCDPKIQVLLNKD